MPIVALQAVPYVALLAAGSPRPSLAILGGMRHDVARLCGVEFTLPAADNDGGDAVPDDIGERAALAQEFFDAREECQCLDGNGEEVMRQGHAAVAVGAALAPLSAALKIPSTAGSCAEICPVDCRHVRAREYHPIGARTR